jgi:ribonuclease HI
MSKSGEKLELFLYKTKLDTKTLSDLIPFLKEKTVHNILQDLQVFQVKENEDVTDDKIYIFTDGGCKNNGKNNAKGAYSVFFEEHSSLNKSGLVISEPTNQKAELTAILKSLEILNENSEYFKNKQIVIVTDSMYSINCVTKWSKNWKTNGWKNAKGQSIKNKEIIVEIVDLYEKLEKPPKFQHVFSHTKEPSEKNTLAYQLWYGNYQVDKAINDLLENEFS